MVLEPSILEYCVAWYSSVPCSSTTKNFLIAQFPPQQCHGGKTSRNLSLRNSSTIKSGISLYSSETVFFYKKISEIGDIWPFWPSFKYSKLFVCITTGEKRERISYNHISSKIKTTKTLRNPLES